MTGAGLRDEQRGVTGIETAIILIAFVVVASVFAYTVLSTGLVTTEKSKETIISGIEEASATLVLRGSVVAQSTSTPGYVTAVKFYVSNASRSGSAINLSTSGLNAAVVTYTDSDQAVNLSTWSTNWLTGSGPSVDAGESVEITVTLTGLATKLVASKEFTIQIRPASGAVLVVNRTLPMELNQAMDLH